MPRHPEATLADVAQAAGVALSTASRILNGESGHRVAEATRDRVLAAARQLSYRPNTIARGLRTARTFTLGIAVPQLENPVFPQIIVGAEAAARERGYSLLISHVAESDTESRTYERLAGVSRVDGLLVATLEDDTRLAAALATTSRPFVVLNRKLRGVDNHAVFDSFAAAEMATAHLIALGHRRIAHLAGRMQGYNGTRRLAGYRAALRAAGFRRDTERVVPAGYTFEGGVVAMRELLRDPVRPTGLVAATMLAAAGAMKVLHDEDVDIPGEMSIVAIHDATIADMLYPPLTTVRLPAQELGASATRGLVDLIEGKTKGVSITLPPQGLVLRASTGPVAAGAAGRGPGTVPKPPSRRG
jgi:LacI family transcriptional regulator